MKVLVIQQKMIGDVLTSTILCENIKINLLNSKVHYLVNSQTEAVVENNPYIDKIVSFIPKYRKSKLAFYSFLKEIKKEKYDIVIDIYGKLESNLICLFSKAPITISYKKWYTTLLFSHVFEYTNKEQLENERAIESRLKLLRPILPEVKNFVKKPKIYLSDKEISVAKSFLKAHKVDFSKPIIMINVLGSSDRKSYPLTYMAEIINTICEHISADLLFNYSPEQFNKAQELYNLCKVKTKERIHFEAYASNLRSFLGVLYHCNASIGNEGGAINMAKALNVPTFSIFSPWITKISWHVFKSESNIAVHLEDFYPEKIEGKSRKKLREESLNLYLYLKPSLIMSKLKDFLSLKIITNE